MLSNVTEINLDLQTQGSALVAKLATQSAQSADSAEASAIIAENASEEAAAAIAIINETANQVSFLESPGFVNGDAVKLAMVDKNNKVISYISSAEDYVFELPVRGDLNGAERDALSNSFPNVYAIVDQNGRVVIQVANDKTYVPQLTMPDGLTTFKDNLDGYLLRSSPDIVCYGDSLTAGGQGVNGDTYPALLQAILTDRTVSNFGIGSQTSEQIGARFGASPVLFEAVGNLIVGAGASTSLEPPNIDLLLNTGNRSIDGWLGGIYGRLSRTGGLSAPVTGQYTFLPGKYYDNDTVVPNPVQFIPDATAQRKSTVIIWVGRNDTTTAGAGLSDIVERVVVDMIDACTVIKPNFIVCSLINATNEDDTTPAYENIYATNDMLRQRFGNRFYDGLSFLPKNADGTIQAAYMADVVHLNDLGYEVWAENLANHIIRNGY